MSYLGLDFGINHTGWCIGTGAETPICGTWTLTPPKGIDPADLGYIGRTFKAKLQGLFAIHGKPTVACYESPLLDRYRDKVLTLRKTFGLGFWFETEYGDEMTIEECHHTKIKSALGGGPKASKDDVVAGAKRLGVILPPNVNQGIQDAADACGAWLHILSLYDRRALAKFDQRLYGRKVGTLL